MVNATNDWLFDGIPLALVITNRRGQILRANAACAALFQTSVATLGGTPLYTFVDMSCRRDFRARLNQAIRGLDSGEQWRWALSAHDGAIIDVLSDLLPMPSPLVETQLCWVIRYASRGTALPRRIAAN